jgi:heme oxygenase (biliverdin-IX-beta and delta-forming)
VLRDALKAATHAAHVRLEKRLALDAADLTLDRYTRYLECMLGFHRTVARGLEPARLVWSGAADCGIRVRWLEADLEDLGVEARYPAMPAHLLPGLRERPEIIGCSYVVEGASLGGLVLYRRLCDRWHLGQARGGSFLFGYGPGTAARWKRFVDAMNAAPLDEAGVRRCVDTARRTFGAVDSWLEQTGWEMTAA